MHDVQRYEEADDVMTIINPKLCKWLTIQVEVKQRGVENIPPHVCVYHDKTRNPQKCSYICLNKAEYCASYKDAPVLPPKLKAEFIEVMTTVYVRPVTGEKITGYEQSVDVWVDTFEQDYGEFIFNDKNELVMPDYTKL